MKTLLTVNLTTKSAAEGSSEWSPASFTFGETLTLALRCQQNVNGVAADYSGIINAVKASIGQVDARPEGGLTRLQIGPGASTPANTTAAFSPAVAASELAALINALPQIASRYGTATVSDVDGSFLLQFGSGSQEVPLTLRANRLWPETRARISAWQQDGAWVQELRLTQTAVAFTSNSTALLPPVPAIARLVAGGSADGFYWNEVQTLTIPANFRGTFRLTRGPAKTTLLSIEDSVDDIETALAALGGGLTATNPLPSTVNIEFGGDNKGEGQDLLGVEALNAPVGDLTFTLPLDREPLAKILRRVASVTLPLQVRLNVTEAGVTKWIDAFVIDITIERPVIWPDDDEVPGIDWLRAISPRSYTPFDASQVITGQQFFPAILGDGTATSFPIAHGLDTEVVFVFVRENVDGGRQLVAGTDYSVVINSANEVRVAALTGPPPSNAWAAVVMSARTVAAFANDLTVEIGQVHGLQDFMTAITAAVGALEALAPTALSLPQSGSTSIVIPDAALIWPGDTAITDATKPLASAPATPAALLAAFNTTTFGTHNATLPTASASNAGQVIQNTGGAPFALPAGATSTLHPAETVPINGYYGSDGRLWYLLNKQGATNSFFAGSMERELFRFPISAQQLLPGHALTLNFTLAAGILRANTFAQCLLVVEVGTTSQETTPSPLSPNLLAVNWSATPMLSQLLFLGSGLVIPGKFGVQINRAADGTTFTANKILYGASLAADALPAAPNFILRTRLIEFDTENAVVAPTGFAFYVMNQASIAIA